MTTHHFRVHGLHCAHEVAAIRTTLADQPGISGLQFDIVAERLVVTLDPTIADPAVIASAVDALGMRAVPWRDSTEPTTAPPWPTRLAMASGLLLLIGITTHIVEVGSVLHALADADDGPAHPISTAIFGIAALAALATILPRAARSLAARRLDMHSLVVVSVIGAALLGEWSEVATVAVLFATANLLESWSAARARHAVTALMRLTPHHAHVVGATGESCVMVEHIHPGTVVRVRPGDRVPIDGDVIAGVSSVDESALSGESVPVAKHEGDRVYAGTLNGTGAIDVRATRHATDSAIARMVATIDTARLRRTRAEQWIEQFAASYTPAVIAAALVIALVPPLFGGDWSVWFYRGLVATLIACPCALVISTPVTIVAALTSAARAGVLVKGGETLEALARTRVVAYDKTGVVTRGDHHVRVVEPIGAHDESTLLARLMAIEARSEHPLARAIVAFAAERGITEAAATSVRALPGRGAEGVVAGEVFWIGSHRLARERHALAPEVEVRARALELDGLTVVLCGDSHSAWALIGLSDSVRDDAAPTIAALTAIGIRHQALLTGDHDVAGQTVARAIGIHDVRASLLPADKEEAIHALRRAHGPVAMIGDGINDTPAMAAADVGIALGPRSTDAALEVADVVIASDDLLRVPGLVAHARHALWVVKQNVWFAVGAKVVFLLAAAAGHASLWMAVAADTGATVLVTLNALRLLRPLASHRASLDDTRPPSRHR